MWRRARESKKRTQVARREGEEQIGGLGVAFLCSYRVGWSRDDTMSMRTSDEKDKKRDRGQRPTFSLQLLCIR
jgi:hypothetical protein